VNCLEITPDKQFLAAGGNPQIRLFEINNSANHNPVLTLEGHTGSVTSLGFQREGRFLYSGSEDGTVKLWDLRSPTFSRSFDCKSPVNSVSLLHPNQTMLLSGDQNGSVKVWDLGTGRCVNDLTPDVHSSSSGAVVAAMDGGGEGGAASLAPPTSAAIQAVDVSEDGRIVIAASNKGDVYAWDPSANPSLFVPVARFRAHPPGTYLLSAKISPDCRHLVTTSSDRTARLWDTSTWDLTSTLAKHEKWVWDAVFSADSSYLVTASSDHSARLWNLRTGEVVRQYTGHQTAVTCVALNDSST